MSGTNDTCRAVREAWLQDAPSSPPSALRRPEPHLDACAACAAWVRAAELHARVLGELGRVDTPAELLDRVAAELVTSAAVGSPRLERELQALRTLTWHPAPAVLERLVAEELAAPEPHRTERFTDLERMRAPDQLARRIERRLRRADLTRRFAPLAGGLAAAAVLGWLTLAGVFRPSEQRRERPFEIVHARDASVLHPWVRDTLGALGADAFAGPEAAAPEGLAPATPGPAEEDRR